MFHKIQNDSKKTVGITLSNPYSMVMNAIAWRENYLNYQVNLVDLEQ